MSKLDCALKDVPQSIIDQIVTEQLKKKVKDFLEEGEADKIMDAMVEKLIIAFCKKRATKIVSVYLEKEGSKIITDAIDCAIEDNGIPDQAYGSIVNAIDDFVKSKFKKGGK